MTSNTNRPIQSDPGLPWYRQFWPWFIFSLPACVVVAGIATVIIANQHADDLVVGDYYKTGLTINRELEKRERAVEMGVGASLAFGENNVSIELTGPASPNTLTLQLSHPMEADRDFLITLNRAPQNRYFGLLPATVEPHWHWILYDPQDQQWRLDGVLQRADFAEGARESATL